MKKTLITTALLAGLSLTVYGQGQIYLDLSDNEANSNAGQWALTTGGLVWTNAYAVSAPQYSTSYGIANNDIELQLFGGSAASAESLIATLLINGSQGSYFADSDITFLGNGALEDQSTANYSFPGVGYGGTAYLNIEAWLDPSLSYSTYAAAYAAAATAPQILVGQTGTFTVVVDASSLLAAPSLDSMPALVLSSIAVPEPSTFAVAGLGAAALLLFRRRS
jgi:hypothetical protein